MDRGGDTDAAGLGQTFEPRRHVDAVAIDVVTIDDDIADIDAVAEDQSLVLGTIGVPARYCRLHFGRKLHRFDGAGELHQHAVAGRLDHAPAMFGNHGIDQLAAQCVELGERPLLVGLHQPRVAGQIGREDGGQSTLNALVGHPRGCPSRRAYWSDTMCPLRESIRSGCPWAVATGSVGPSPSRCWCSPTAITAPRRRPRRAKSLAFVLIRHYDACWRWLAQTRSARRRARARFGGALGSSRKPRRDGAEGRRRVSECRPPDRSPLAASGGAAARGDHCPGTRSEP